MSATPIAWQWGGVDASDHGERTCLTHRHAGVQLWVAGGRLVRGSGYDAADTAVRQELARVGAIIRLRQRGRYLVHAAGVVDPSGRAWLLSGDSGSGKSTLAYALARTGWTVLGDDGVPIERRGDGLVAHSWREPLRVSRELDTAFPELADDRLRPMPNDPRDRVPVTMRGTRSAPVAAVVLVERATSFAIAPVAPLSALATLVRQSPWVILGDEHARAHLELLHVHARSLVAAGFMVLVTSLPQDIPAEEIFAAYRLRWQIELAIKWLKSVLHIDDLPTRTPHGSLCWLHAHLIMALLSEDIRGDFLESSP